MRDKLKFIPALAAALVVCAATADHGLGEVACAPPHFSKIQSGFRYGFPPEVLRKGLWFAGRNVPISRPDVRERILREVNYLLMDRRSRVLVWLSGAHRLSSVIAPILGRYKLPREFIYLSAIESSYNGRAMSSAGAFGYWQFMKATALRGPSGSNKYDWSMNITRWKDERGDLIVSTHAAARYLAWMNREKKVALKGKPERNGFRNWLLTSAAYNAGPARVIQRLNAYGETSYWDVPLPEETLRYVPRWIALGLISRYRTFYGIQTPRPQKINYDTVRKVRLKKNLSLTAVARLLSTTPRAIWTLNTQIPTEKGIFPAKGGRSRISHTIRVPKGTRKKFLAKLKAHGYIN